MKISSKDLNRLLLLELHCFEYSISAFKEFWEKNKDEDGDLITPTLVLKYEKETDSVIICDLFCSFDDVILKSEEFWILLEDLSKTKNAWD